MPYSFRTVTRSWRALAATLLGLLVLIGSGCAEPGEAVATVSIGINRATVPLGGPIELSIRFVASPRLEPLEEDYRVLVHFLDANGDLMWAEDHDPPVPTTAWRPGETISYTRRATVPMYPYIGEATVAVGLYATSTGERAMLAGEDLGQRAYLGTVLNLEPQAGSSFLLYEDGWHTDEFDPDSNQQWRWTSERGSLSFRNPRSDAVLYLQFDGRPDLFDTPQHIDILVGDEVLHEIVVDSRELQFEELELRSGQLGDSETVRLDLRVDPTFVPSEVPGGATDDDRRLGVRVYYAFLEPR